MSRVLFYRDMNVAVRSQTNPQRVYLRLVKHHHKAITCDLCGQAGARLRKVTETYGKGRNLLLIENVPMISCLNCGESYFTAETLHEIERIKTHRHNLATQRPVAVAAFV